MCSKLTKLLNFRNTSHSELGWRRQHQWRHIVTSPGRSVQFCSAAGSPLIAQLSLRIAQVLDEELVALASVLESLIARTINLTGPYS